MSEKVFAMAQLDLVNKLCFDCGKILVAQFVAEGITMAICKEERCPFEKKRKKYCLNENGNMVWLRKLKEAERKHE